MGISVDEFVERYPRLFHMTEHGSWDSIRCHGLLSTSALLDLHRVRGPERAAMESRRRPHAVELASEGIGRALIRDQKPLSDGALARALRDGLTPGDWYRILNRKVFFWVEEQRLESLLRARSYRDRHHTVLTVDTRELLARHRSDVVLAPINSGNTARRAQPRGLQTFLPLDRYPFASWSARRRGREPVVELAVHHAVPDIAACVIEVETRGCGAPFPGAGGVGPAHRRRAARRAGGRSVQEPAPVQRASRNRLPAP